MGRKQYYDDRPRNMSRGAMEVRAKAYASTGRGWQCPECATYVRAGEYLCYACGSYPEVDYSSGSGSAYEGTDAMIASMGWFVFFCLAPVIYGFVDAVGPHEGTLLFILPVAIMIKSGITGFRYIWIEHFGSRKLKEKYHKYLDNTGWYSIFVRGWVMFFSLRTAWIIGLYLYSVFAERYEYYEWEYTESFPMIGVPLSLTIIFIVGAKILAKQHRKQRRTQTSKRENTMRLLKATGLLILSELLSIPAYAFLVTGLMSKDYWRTISSLADFFKAITPIYWYVILTVVIALLMRKYAKTHTTALTLFILAHVAISVLSAFMYIDAYMTFF